VPELYGNYQQRHLAVKVEKLGEKWVLNFAYEVALSYSQRSSMYRTILQQGTDSFTSPPNEVMLRIFIAYKIHRPQLGLNPHILGPMASMLTARPLSAT
jgi:hypothetical protein